MRRCEDSLVTRKTGEINALELKGGKQAVWHRNLPPSRQTRDMIRKESLLTTSDVDESVMDACGLDFLQLLMT